MYEFPVRYSSESGSDGYGSFSYGSRSRTTGWSMRHRGRRSRRYLLYLVLLAGFCVLLAFAGCGTSADCSGVQSAPSNVFAATIPQG
jgi:hypothetical protein